MKYANFDLDVTSYICTGAPVVLDIWRAETRDGVTLVEGDDYELVFYDEDDNALEGAPSVAGSYSVRLRGIGDYTGESYSESFRIISANDISFADVDLQERPIVYGAEDSFTPQFVLTLRGETLTEGMDYTVEYRDYSEDEDNGTVVTPPLGVGEYRAFFTGVGNYEGSTSQWFSVYDACDLAYGNLELYRHIYAYTGSSVTPDVEGVWSADGSLLQPGEDYRLVYASEEDFENEVWSTEAPSQLGYYHVRAEGLGSYYGYSYSYGLRIVSRLQASSLGRRATSPIPAAPSSLSLRLPSTTVWTIPSNLSKGKITRFPTISPVTLDMRRKP